MRSIKFCVDVKNTRARDSLVSHRRRTHARTTRVLLLLLLFSSLKISTAASLLRANQNQNQSFGCLLLVDASRTCGFMPLTDRARGSVAFAIASRRRSRRPSPASLFRARRPLLSFSSASAQRARDGAAQGVSFPITVYTYINRPPHTKPHASVRDAFSISPVVVNIEGS